MTDNNIDIVDNEWRADKLPDEDIQVPLDRLPDPESNEEGASFSLNQVCNLQSVSLCLVLSFFHFDFSGR